MPKGIYARNGIYWARFKVKGVEYRESLRTRSLSVAEKRMKVARQAVEDRVFFGAEEAVTWEAAVVAWSDLGAKSLGIKASTMDRYITSFGQIAEHLEGKTVREITTKLLKDLVRKRQLQGASNATIRRDLTAISSVLGVAEDNNWIEDNPARTINRARFKEAPALIVLPRPDAIARVFVDPSRFMDLARFSKVTGMREEEVASLQHDRIDRKRMVATLERTKGNRVRQVTLTPEALAIIDKQPRHIRYRYVFWEGDGDRFTNVAERWRNKMAGAARKAAQAEVEFQRFRFHDLRHLFAVTFLTTGRGSIYDLQQELGHASIQTTERYLDHLSSDEKARAKSAVAQNAAPVHRSEEGNQ